MPQRVLKLSWDQKVALFRECQLYARKMEAMFAQRRELVASLKVRPLSRNSLAGA